MKGRLGFSFLLVALVRIGWGGPLDGPQQGLLGARAAGMGGLGSAGDVGLEALIYNPAGLPSRGVHGGAFAGSDPGPDGQGGLAVSAPMDDVLTAGFFWGGLQAWGPNALMAQTVALAAAAQWGPHSSLGLRGQWHQLESPTLGAPVRGASLDLGWQARQLRGPWLPGDWALGLGADHVLGFWPDSPWGQALPLVVHAGLSYQPWPSLSLGAQGDWASSAYPDQGSAQTWRGGLQWKATPVLALRTGWSDDGSKGLLSVGLSLHRPGPGGGRLDYAAFGGLDGGAWSQRLAMGWAWAYVPATPMGVRTVQLLRDPKGGVVRSARLDVTLSPLLRLRPWHVELVDGQGLVWRTLEPVDLQDPSVAWDGRDDQGRLLPPPKGLRAVLVATGAQGALRVLAPDTLEQSLQRLAWARPDAALPSLSFKPVFEGAQDDQLSHVLIQLPALRALSWSLDIEDGRQRSVRTLSGQGDLPSSLVWDGRDQAGHKVNDVLGAQVSLRVVDRQGVSSAQRLPLFNQKAFAFAFAQRERYQRPELSLASLGMPLLLNRPALDWQAGFLPALRSRAQRRLSQDLAQQRSAASADRRRRYLRQEGPAEELDLFEPGRSVVLAQRLDLLASLESRLGQGATDRSTLWVQGMARRDEAQPQALARRRAVALAQALRRHGEDLQLVLQSPGPPGDFKGVRLELRPAIAAERAAPSTQALALAAPDRLRARYQPVEPPQGLGLAPPPLPPGAWRLWGSDPGAVAWCPATGKLAFFRDGWIWVTDGPGTVLRTLWFDPELAAAGQCAWSADGRRLWIRADQWRGWLSLQLEIEARPDGME